MADSRLALVQPGAQCRDVQLSLASQVQQDSQPRFIGKQLEDLQQFVFEFVGEKQALGRGFHQVRAHRLACLLRCFRRGDSATGSLRLVNLLVCCGKGGAASVTLFNQLCRSFFLLLAVFRSQQPLIRLASEISQSPTGDRPNGLMSLAGQAGRLSTHGHLGPVGRDNAIGRSVRTKQRRSQPIGWFRRLELSELRVTS